MKPAISCFFFACTLLFAAPHLTRATIHQVASSDSISLAGVVDFHCHTAPDINPRSLNDLQLVRLAKQAGMRGLILKNHYTMTADRAQLAMEEVGGIEVFGGIVLNRSVGGINAEAVRLMVRFAGRRGKVVWLPTVDAEHAVGNLPGHRPYVPVVKNGKPVPELTAIFELVKQNDLVLETGHSSPEESLVIIAAAKRAGVKKIVATHAMAMGATPDQLKQMATSGAFIECCWLNYISKPDAATGMKSTIDLVQLRECAGTIQTIGAEHFLISSDLGQKDYPLQTAGLRTFLGTLAANGLSQRDLDLVARINPARLLGLEAW